MDVQKIKWLAQATLKAKIPDHTSTDLMSLSEKNAKTNPHGVEWNEKV